jgi:hypothetical protein
MIIFCSLLPGPSTLHADLAEMIEEPFRPIYVLTGIWGTQHRIVVLGSGLTYLR